MTDHITLTGVVATPPRHITTGEGLAITSFRLASTRRVYDRASGSWVERDTNWYTVTAFRSLAVNAADSIVKGDRIIVTGRLRLRDWSSGERSGTTVEVEADAIGHDLCWGTTRFQRLAVAVSDAEAPPAEVETAEEETAALPVSALLAAGLASGRVSLIPVGFSA